MNPILIAIVLLAALVVVGVMLTRVGGARSSRRGKRAADADLGVDSVSEGANPVHKVPHPEQTAREKGTLFPPRAS